ncbi:hypothetical protein [Arthrobacter sp. AFG20]|nr:hypothetical protein [Arthrobacter sp. AFG20]
MGIIIANLFGSTLVPAHAGATSELETTNLGARLSVPAIPSDWCGQ